MNKKLILLILMFISIQPLFVYADTINGTTTSALKYVTYYPTKTNPTSTITDYVNAGASPAIVGIQYTDGTNPPFQRDNYVRSRDRFNISLNENEIINSAILSVTTNYLSGSGNFNITYISDPIGGTASDIFEENGSGSSIGSMSYNGGTQNFDITSILANQVGQKSYSFGFSEIGYGCASLNIILTITKSILPSATIYVRNNFSGGLVKAAINNSTPPQVSAPATISSYATRTVYIGAVESQSSDGYSWIFNDSEAPLNVSNWEIRNADDIYMGVQSHNANTSFQLSTSINNYKYVAAMRKLYNLSFQSEIGGNIL